MQILLLGLQLIFLWFVFGKGSIITASEWYAGKLDDSPKQGESRATVHFLLGSFDQTYYDWQAGMHYTED